MTPRLLASTTEEGNTTHGDGEHRTKQIRKTDKENRCLGSDKFEKPGAHPSEFVHWHYISKTYGLEI